MAIKLKGRQEQCERGFSKMKCLKTAKALTKCEDKCKRSASCSLEHDIQRGTSHEQCKPAQNSTISTSTFRQGHMASNSNRTDIESALRPHSTEIWEK